MFYVSAFVTGVFSLQPVEGAGAVGWTRKFHGPWRRQHHHFSNLLVRTDLRNNRTMMQLLVVRVVALWHPTSIVAKELHYASAYLA